MSQKSFATVWKSPSLDRWHWIFAPHGADEHTYSGIAPSKEAAWTDIVLSAEHFIKANKYEK